MKRKLLFAAAILLFAVCVKAQSYSASVLAEDGWTKINSISQADITNNFYVFLSEDETLILRLENSTNQSNQAAFYRPLADPSLDSYKVWTLEANGNNYAMRNSEWNSRQMQTEWSASSNDLRWRTNDQMNSISWTGLALAYNNDAWTLTSTQYTRPLGIYNNGTGTPQDGNEIGANDSSNGQTFQIYAISKSEFWELAASKASANNPVDFTAFITNPEIYNNNKVVIPRGWSEGSERATGNNNRTAGTGITQLEAWTGGNNTLKATYYQNLTGLPLGKYKLTANAGDSNGTGGGVIYLNNGSDEKTVDIPHNDGEDVTTPEILVTGTGSLQLGMRVNGKGSWVHATNFRLYYCGVDLSDYINAWMAALTAARTTAATNEKIANWVRTNLNTVISDNDEDHVDQNNQAALEAATAALVEANELGQKSIHSYAVIAQGFVPDNSLEGWVCENTNDFVVNTWSTEGNNDGSNMKTPFIQNWVGKGSFLGEGKVYYRLEGLEPGEVYRVEALVRSYNEASADAPNGPNFYVNDDEADLTEVGKTFTYNNMSGIYGTQIAAATIGADGVLELGVTIDADRNYNWVAFKNIKISTFDAALEAAIAKVTACEGQVPEAVYNTAYAVVEAYTDNKPTTVDGFMTAIAEIEQAAADLAPAVEAYAAYLELKGYADALVAVGNDNAEANSELATAISTAVENIAAATNVAEETEVNTTLRTAMNTYAAEANPVGDDSKFDLTFMIQTPDLTGMGTGGPAPGWYTEQEGVNSQKIDDGRATAEGSDKTSFFECWSWTAKANDRFTLYTPVTLPEGTYTMSCYAFARQQDGETGNDPIVGVYFYANDTQGSSVSNPYLELKEVSFVNSEEQEVKIGLKAVSTGNTYNWMGIGYVKLYKVPAQAFAIGGDAWDPATEGAGDVTIARSINVGYNAYILPFNMTQAEVEEVFGEGSTVKVVRAFDAENEILKFSTREGIAANVPCIVKATAAHAAGEVVVPGRTLVPAAASEIVYTGEGLTMTGCYAAKTNVPQYSLFVKDAQLIYNESDEEGVSYISSTRAYITLEDWEPGENGIKGMTIIDDDEATGIAVVENGQLNLLTGKVYDLSGRAVKNPTKGLYIIDGKKVFLK